MQRDMDLVREILRDVEAQDPEKPSLSTSDPKYAYHFVIMKDAGLVEGFFRTGIHGEPTDATITRLTWQGHDFLDAARDDTLWKAAKAKFIKPGISWTFSILSEWLKQEAHRKIFGVPPSS